MKMVPFGLIVVLGLIILGVRACSSPPGGTGPTTSASPLASGSASASRRIYVVTSADTQSQTTMVDVHFITADGKMVDEFSFTPEATGGTVRQEPFVVSGRVIYVDNFGTVWARTPKTTPVKLAAFPLSARTVVSVGVSPDLTQVLASFWTYPAAGNPGVPYSTPTSGPAGLVADLDISIKGSTPSRLTSQTIPLSGHAPMVVGWDASGPLVIADQQVIANGFTPRSSWLGHLAHLSTDGKVGANIGGSDCYAWQITSDEHVLCGFLNPGPTAPAITLRDANGTTVMTADRCATFQEAWVSPGASSVACGNLFYNQTGSTTELPLWFVDRGWADDQTLAGAMDVANSSSLFSTPPPNAIHGDLILLKTPGVNPVDLWSSNSDQPTSPQVVGYING